MVAAASDSKRVLLAQPVTSRIATRSSKQVPCRQATTARIVAAVPCRRNQRHSRDGATTAPTASPTSSSTAALPIPLSRLLSLLLLLLLGTTTATTPTADVGSAAIAALLLLVLLALLPLHGFSKQRQLLVPSAPCSPLFNNVCQEWWKVLHPPGSR